MATMTGRFETVPGAELWRPEVRKFQAAPPVDVVRLAENFGLKVWEMNLPEGISGKIQRDEQHGGTAKYSIIVSQREPSYRKRFTVAHELAHFLLHKGEIGDGVSDDALYRSNKLTTLAEVQANRLAADILMPFQLIENEMKSGVLTINELAHRFKVSEQAMRIRLGVPD